MSAEQMQVADLLPFVNQNIANLHRDVCRQAEWAIAAIDRNMPEVERHKTRPTAVRWLWRRRALTGLVTANYAPGAVFDYHGAEAMVVSTRYNHDGVTAEFTVLACVRNPKGRGVRHFTIAEPLALALVWKRHNLLGTAG